MFVVVMTFNYFFSNGYLLYGEITISRTLPVSLEVLSDIENSLLQNAPQFYSVVTLVSCFIIIFKIETIFDRVKTDNLE